MVCSKQLLSFILVSAVLFGSFITNGNCLYTNKGNKVLAQEELSPLEILILDLQDVKELIQQGENKTAVTILKSAEKEVRKVTEFDKETKSITTKRIKKGIALLKKGKNNEALELIQTGIDALEEAGFIEPGSLN